MRGFNYKQAQVIKKVGLIALLLLVLSFVVWGCMKTESSSAPNDSEINSEVKQTAGETNLPKKQIKEVKDLKPNNASKDYNTHLDAMPDSGSVALDYRRLGNFNELFNDSNYVHLESSQALGVDPIVSVGDAWNVKRPLARIVPCKDYFVDKLTHSFPYLVPEAKKLLTDIGRSFNNALIERGGGDYRLRVTSLLRTHATVKKLKKQNSAAVDSSAHQYGTTFDISYMNFACDSKTVVRTQDDLKGLLGEVLHDLRAEGRCHVKYERKQGCFHITVRKND